MSEFDVVAFLTARADEDDSRYREVAEIDNPKRQHYLMHECGDYNEGFIIEEALRRLDVVETVRDLLKIHNTYGVLRNEPEDLDQSCIGCNLANSGDYAVPDVNECPTLLALARIWRKHPDYREQA